MVESVEEVEGYDLIGDIHGYAETLKKLLLEMGYQQEGRIFSHSRRKAVFLGDYVDRGPHQEETIAIVRNMVEAGQAYAIMGNHEYNAIAFYTPVKEGEGHLRQRSEKNVRQHRAFLEAYENHPAQWQEVIEWFKTLPLWLDLGGVRVVHACWDEQAIERLRHYPRSGQWLSDQLLHDSVESHSPSFHAIEVLLKGKELPLPAGHFYHDKEGVKRQRIRVRWWDPKVDSYRSAFMGPEQERTHIPDDPIEGDHLIEYSHSSPPLFLGHYWLSGEPKPLADNIACLDYSVAKPHGSLAAYRWSGEKRLKRSNFVTVMRAEP